ncbi:MAG TPA: nucleotidyltransferase family protein [Gaiellaceae bacterium]|nr:nucleotidyltransferase family protein [Gaiellaceae bacterium]
MTPADDRGTTMPSAGLWERVDRLIDRAPDLAGLRAHRLHLLAARRWRALGRTVPEDLVREERLAAMWVVTAPVVLRRLREACGGPVLLVKGLEVASHYPDRVLRPFIDVDVIVPDAEKVQGELLAAGFVPMAAAEHVAAYHLTPLRLPDLPVRVEVHRRPRWIAGFEGPSHDLFSLAVESRSGVAGIGTLPAGHHAMVVAAHSWLHEPLRRALDLVDVAVLCEGQDEEELRSLARAYGLERVWRTTEAARRALLGDGPAPLSLRLWARNLAQLRERTVLEFHLARWLGGFWALPPRRAAARLASALAEDVLPAPGETWKAKLARARLALRDAAVARSLHEREINRAGRNGDGRAADLAE